MMMSCEDIEGFLCTGSASSRARMPAYTIPMQTSMQKKENHEAGTVIKFQWFVPRPFNVLQMTRWAGDTKVVCVGFLRQCVTQRYLTDVEINEGAVVADVAQF